MAEQIKNKLNFVLEKNKGFQKIKEIANFFSLDTIRENNDETNYSSNEIISFKYAPITSVDVERSFSVYKSILRPNRSSFTFENLKKVLFVYINKNLF